MCLQGMKKTMVIGIRGKKVMIQVDRCICGIVRALNGNGIYTTKSCCGHGKTNGTIKLEDGRRIEIIGSAR